MSETDDKRSIGLYGEMCLALELHKREWQVYRAYIDEQIDFIIAKYYCKKCKKFSSLEKRQHEERKEATFPTNLCASCLTDSLEIAVRFIQAKTSVGVDEGRQDGGHSYSFHAKLRSNVDEKAFYAWIALVGERKKYIPHFFIFNHTEICKFDDINLKSYQGTDNQKTELPINEHGEVLKEGRKYDYSCFNDDFHNNFDKLYMNEK